MTQCRNLNFNEPKNSCFLNTTHTTNSSNHIKRKTSRPAHALSIPIPDVSVSFHRKHQANQ